MRSGFDILSGYTFGTWRGRLDEKQWIKRIIFLETVAGVPGGKTIISFDSKID